MIITSNNRINMFTNRTDAGQQLATKLLPYRTDDVIVLTLPRGGVVLGYEIAQTIDVPFDILVTRKIGHPANSEYAIGAVDEQGTTVLNETETALIDQQWLQAEIARQQAEAVRRSVVYRQGKPEPDITGKTVIIVDDGIATGFTMRLAVRVVKKQQPKKIIIAVPVAPLDSIAQLKKEGADEVIIVERPEEFMGSVGAHYQSFEQVSDSEVIRLLHA